MKSRLPLLVVVAALALLSAPSASPSATAKRWYWTERYTQTQIYLTDATDRWDRQPGPFLTGDAFISDRVDCTGFPPVLRRSGLRMYRSLECVFTIHHIDSATGEEISDGVWTGRITPIGREDYLGRWRHFA